jgi:hypothetical protein
MMIPFLYLSFLLLGRVVFLFHRWLRWPDVMAPLTNPTQTGLLDSCLTNKLHRLSLATFDDEGNYVTYLVTCHYITSLTPVWDVWEKFLSTPFSFVGSWGVADLFQGKKRRLFCFLNWLWFSFLSWLMEYTYRTLPYIDGVLGGNQVICQQHSFHRRRWYEHFDVHVWVPFCSRALSPLQPKQTHFL